MAAEPDPNLPKIKTVIDWKNKNRHQNVQEINVYGSWNRFGNAHMLEYQGGGKFSIQLELPIGDHHYRFLVDDDWKTDDSKPKTILHGEEFNWIKVQEKQEEEEEEAPGAVGDGSQAMIFDAANQSFRIGKSKDHNRAARRRGRPSMEISLPANFVSGAAKSSLEQIDEDDDGRKKRRKKKKKKKKGGLDLSGNSDLAAAFKQKEEEWARMCFVQQLKQQQQHNDEIQRVKTLWKQERQVRVEMHKKVVAAKADMEKRIQALETDNERLRSNAEVNKQTMTKKNQQLETGKSELEKEKNELREKIKEQEEMLRQARLEKANIVSEQQKSNTGASQELMHMKAEVATKNATIEGLQGQLEAVNQNMNQIQDMHKRTLTLEQSRYEHLQNLVTEEKQDRLKLKEQCNELQIEVMNKEREVQRNSDQNQTLSNKQKQLEQQNQMQLEKVNQLKEDLKNAEAAAKDTSRIQEATEKVRFELTSEKQILQSKIEGLEIELKKQKESYEEQIQNTKDQHEQSISVLSERSEAATSSQISEINKRLNDKDELINQSKQQLAKVEEQLRAVEVELASAKANNQRSAETEKVLNERVAQLTGEIATMRAQLEKEKENKARVSSEKEDAKLDFESKIQELQSTITNAKAESASASSNTEAAREENSKLQNTVSELEKKIYGLETDLGKTTEEKSEVQQELNKISKALDSEQKKNSNMAVRVEELESEFGEREEELIQKLHETEAEVDRITEQANNRVHELDAEREKLLNELNAKRQMFTDVEARLQKMENEMRIAKDSWERERETLQTRLSLAESRDERIMASCKNMFKEFKEVRTTLDSIRTEKVEMVEKMNGFFPNMQTLLTKAFSFNQRLVSEVTDKYKREMSLRRKYFNQLQELRGNIRVFCRIRPLLPFEEKKGLRNCLTFPEDDQLIVHQADTKSDEIFKHFFEFDRVYVPDFSQEQVCEDTSEYIQSVMDGYNVSIFAYGQTGSGKTFTMMGPKENPGVNRRALSELFKIVEQREGMYDYTIKVAMFEIYNDKPKDLLVDKVDQKKKISSSSASRWISIYSRS